MTQAVSLSTSKLKKLGPYVAVFALALAVRGLTALQLAGPENLDAEYYFLLAQNLVRGRGFVLDAIWHFLDNPQGLPHPAGEFWLPLTSLIQASALLLGQGYRYAQIPQVIMSSMLVVLAFRFTQEISSSNVLAYLAAFFALFGGATVMGRQVDVDCYATYAFAGSLALYALYRGQKSSAWLCASGLFIGLASLTRKDGVLLLGVLLFYLAYLSWRRIPYSRAAALAAITLFAAVNLPWQMHTWYVFGQLQPVPAWYPALLREYADFFAYRPRLDWQHFLSWGWQWQVQARIAAAIRNAARLAWVLQFWQVPFCIAGLWAWRKRHVMIPIWLYPLLSYLLLTMVYTFPSERGTWLHSLGPFVPFGAAFSAAGLQAAAQSLSRRFRALRPSLLQACVQCSAAFLACVLGVAMARAEIAANQRWTAGRKAIGQWVVANTSPHTTVMSNDPLGIALEAGRPAVAVPYGDLPTVLQVADRFTAQYLILWEQRPQGLFDFVADPAHHDRLHLLQQWEQVRIFRIDPVEVAEVYP
ncbi:MAG: glycosyltransferase family 39 protein [Chloroflexi bacterium]|nr:glycosyltransferase family 39 protein [Chloroflexota bacterium]